MATTTYLVITDGTTTCTFADGAATPGATNYEVAYNGWSPAVAGLRRSPFGPGLYGDVVETMQINVTGSSAANALANLQALETLIERGEKYGRGENVNCVTMQYSPGGGTVSSTGTPLKYEIVGFAPGETHAVTLPQNFEGPLLKNGKYVVGGTLRFLRKGDGLLSTTSANSGTAVANPSVMSVTLSDHPVLSPLYVLVNGIRSMPSETNPWRIFVAPSTSHLALGEAEVGTATGWTSVADTGANASGGAVLRYTPTGTSESTSGRITFSASTGPNYAFYAAIRNNSASVTWQLRLGGMIASAVSAQYDTVAYTPKITIDTSTTNPRFIPLGSLALPRGLQGVQLLATASSTSGSPTLDIDYIVCITDNDPRCSVVEVYDGGSTPSNSSSVIIDHRRLQNLTPQITHRDDTVMNYNVMRYKTNPYLFTSGTTVAVLAVCMNTGSTYWNNNNSGTTTNFQATATRYTAYITPV